MPRPRLIPVFSSFGLVLVAYWFYALVVVGLIEPAAGGRVRGDGLDNPADSVDELAGLAEHFPPDHFVRHKPKMLESRQAKLLFGDYTKDPQNERKVELRPCTMIFTPDEPGVGLAERNRRAVILDAPEGALLEFDQPLELRQAKIGRLLAGQLQGPVVIRSQGKLPGPEDDLRIDTRDVDLSEQRISTSHPVEFRWGFNHGRGQGLCIDLLPDKKAPQHGPNVGGIKSLELSKVERIHLQFNKKDMAGAKPGSGQPSKDAKKDAGTQPAEITCRGPFRFDVEGKVASFRDQVDVWQIMPSGPSDHLSCEVLSIYFVPKKKANPAAGAAKQAGGPKAGGGKGDAGPLDLEPQRIEATGNPVAVHAPSRMVEARGQRLEYDLQSGRTVLGGSEEVFLTQGANQIHARSVQYQPAGPGRLGQILAEGPGWLVGQSPDKPDDQLEARWNKQLQVRPHQQNQVISLAGSVELYFRGVGRLVADEVHFWLTEKPDPAKSGRATLQPDRMLARKDVRIHHPQMDAAVNQMEVWFENLPPQPGAKPEAGGPLAVRADGGPPRLADWVPRIFGPAAWTVRSTALGAVRLMRLTMARQGVAPTAIPSGPLPPAQIPLDPVPPGQGPAVSAGPPLPSQQRFDVVGDLLQVQVLVRGRKTELSELVVEGNVRLLEQQTEKPGERPMLVSGQRIHVVDASTPGAAVAVTGQPAHFEARGLELDGSNINLNRGTNRLWIDGPGWMTLPMDRDMDGRQARDAGPLEIHWQQRMDFDGRTVQFEDSVVATSRSHQLRTETMDVTLSQPIRFADTKSSVRPDVQRLVCRGGAYMENRSVDQQGQASVDRVQMGDLAVDLATGDLTGAGPGWFRSIRQGSSQGLEGRLGNLASRQPAGRPSPDDPSLTYISVDFQRSLTGNLRRREMAFANAVKTVYGSVDSWDAVLDPDKPERLGPRGAVLTCDQLAVAEMPTANRTQRATELVASGNTLVEAAAYTARASRISYADLKGLLILEGDGRSDAELFRQERVGAEMSRFAARKIYYWPATNRLSIDDASMMEVNSSSGRPGEEKTQQPATPPARQPPSR
jgi:lipopolysaccharide export system protein LptA